jgi:hypothetical protein
MGKLCIASNNGGKIREFLTSVCGQTMRNFAWFGRNGQLSCPARGEAAGGGLGPPVGRYHGRGPWYRPYPGPGDGSPGKGLQGEGDSPCPGGDSKGA